MTICLYETTAEAMEQRGMVLCAVKAYIYNHEQDSTCVDGSLGNSSRTLHT